MVRPDQTRPDAWSAAPTAGGSLRGARGAVKTPGQRAGSLLLLMVLVLATTLAGLYAINGYMRAGNDFSPSLGQAQGLGARMGMSSEARTAQVRLDAVGALRVLRNSQAACAAAFGTMSAAARSRVQSPSAEGIALRAAGEARAACGRMIQELQVLTAGGAGEPIAAFVAAAQARDEAARTLIQALNAGASMGPAGRNADNLIQSADQAWVVAMQKLGEYMGAHAITAQDLGPRF